MGQNVALPILSTEMRLKVVTEATVVETERE